ncbi:ATP-binding protein [Streptomyces sp. NPDC050121]|uniref:ATP-binding protein n=1 Tax=Streptomyces sp. NPDC050121 TaxID=3365601 RepID=UPI00378C5082
MNSEISTQISTRNAPRGELALRFSSTPRGARLARRLTAQQVVAELAANAVTHGRVPGRDFELRLLLLADDTLRVEVSDTRGDRQLWIVTDPEEEGGRGLILVWVLARTWGVAERPVGKTVWAECAMEAP